MAEIKCPKCESKNIEKKKVSHSFGAITEFGKTPPTRKFEKYRCKDCEEFFEVLSDGSIRRT